VRRTKSDFDQAELAAAVNVPEHNREVVDRWHQAAWAGGKPLITNFFCVDTAHADAMAEEINRRWPGLAVPIHSNLPGGEGKRRVKAFRAGEFRVATSVMMVAEGFDYPALACGVLCRPTKSERLLVQMLGRFLRLHDDKPSALILDCAGSYEGMDLANIYDVVSRPKGMPALTEASKGGSSEEEEEDGIPQLSELISRVRALDIFRAECAQSRTLPWRYCEGRYVLPLDVSRRPKLLVAHADKADRSKVAVALFYYAGYRAACHVLVRKEGEPAAFKIAEAWVRTHFWERDWQTGGTSDRDAAGQVARWYKDRGPISEGQQAKLEDARLPEAEWPATWGEANHLIRTLYAQKVLR
jgi:hypothetical protein